MGTYIIIGGDGKEYGPINDAELRQWFSEGRLSAKSLVKATSDAEFRPLEKFPEFADLCFAGVPEEMKPASTTQVSSADYELDLGGCMSSGWELTRKHFGVLFGSFLLLIIIKIGLSSIINLSLVSELNKIFTSPGATVALGFLLITLNAPVMGPVMGGLYLVYLKTIRNQPTGVGDLFAGFQKHWAQLFLGSLVIELIMALCMAPASYVIAERTNPIVHQLQNLQAQNGSPAEMGKLFSQMLSAYASASPVLLICLIPVTYLTTIWQFTLALIIDKQLPLGAAMKTGWQRVNLHWWQVFGLTVLAYLIAVVGLMGCGVGILFTLPIGTAIMMYGYETLFSSQHP